MSEVTFGESKPWEKDVCPTCGLAACSRIHGPGQYVPAEPQPPVRFAPLQGWICPVCGRGVSPYASQCPCQDGPFATLGGWFR